MKAICSLLAVLCSICLIYCSKKGTPPAAQPGPGVPNDPHGTSTCHTQLSDAEQVMLFPADNPWNKDISASAVDSASGQILAAYAHTGVFADFGSGLWQGAPIGIPFVVVCASQPKIPVVYRSNAYDGNYGDESDPGPYPIPLDAPIEGNGQGDSHVIAIDKDSGVLYELYNASVNGGHWEASSGAIFHLHSDALRPDGWTSADAAGLPIFPGLVRYEEIVKGEIPHPIRFTLTKSHIRPGHISPARHDVN
ncbi:MAG: hypothetical protein Q8927_14560, partial [Bacteroidota bacterium]|nr:hypothetical protein [Bacteroidota bacterium]